MTTVWVIWLIRYPNSHIQSPCAFSSLAIQYPLAIFMLTRLCFLGICLLHSCCLTMLDIHINLAILLCHHPSIHSLLSCLFPCHHVIQAVCNLLVHEQYHISHCLLCQVMFHASLSMSLFPFTPLLSSYWLTCPSYFLSMLVIINLTFIINVVINDNHRKLYSSISPFVIDANQPTSSSSPLTLMTKGWLAFKSFTMSKKKIEFICLRFHKDAPPN